MQNRDIGRIKDFLHYGIDHLFTSLGLFENPYVISYVENQKKIYMAHDSAAYLAYLGIEQILKACILWENKEPKWIHDIPSLVKEIKFLSETLTPEEVKLIEELDQFKFTRYPRENKNKGVSVGTDNKENFSQLYNLILDTMPEELRHICEEIGIYKDVIKKGGRILMKKKNPAPSSLHPSG